MNIDLKKIDAGVLDEIISLCRDMKLSKFKKAKPEDKDEMKSEKEIDEKKKAEQSVDEDDEALAEFCSSMKD